MPYMAKVTPIDFNTIRPGTRITITTRNTTYEFTSVGGPHGFLKGHRQYCPAWTFTTLEMDYPYGVGGGVHLRYRAENQEWVLTTIVRAVFID